MTPAIQRGDAYLEAILERPAMYAGPNIRTLEAVLLNVLNFRSLVFDLDHDPREILRKCYLSHFGHSAGASGPACRLAARHGDDNVANEEVVGFYRAFVAEVVGAR